MMQEDSKNTWIGSKIFIEVETPPVLVKSTPEGARYFVVPSRVILVNLCGLFSQCPQTQSSLLMVSGFGPEIIFQIVNVFSHEDLRADRSA